MSIDPDVPRGTNWEETISIQHELLPNFSVTGGYYRRQFYNTQYTTNLDVDPVRDYTPFTIVGPSNPNLPNGGGEIITLYNLNDDKRGVVNSVLTWSENRTRVYNGFEMSFNARLGRGFVFGGITTERTATDNCTDLTNSNPNGLRFCKQVPPFRTLYKVSGSCIGCRATNFRLAAVVPGASWHRDWVGQDYTVTPAIAGRPLTGGVSNIVVNLADPTQLFYDYVYLERRAAIAHLQGRRYPAGASVHGSVQPREQLHDLHAQRDVRTALVRPDLAGQWPAVPVRRAARFLASFPGVPAKRRHPAVPSGKYRTQPTSYSSAIGIRAYARGPSSLR